MRPLLLALAACALACSGKGASFEGAKLVTQTKPTPVPDERMAKLSKKDPPTAAPFTVTATARADWMVGEGLLITIWHDSGAGAASEIRAAIDKERKPLPQFPGRPAIILRDMDELTDGPNYLFWKRHTVMPGGVGMNERYIIARAQDGAVHRWSAGCMDLMQEGRCPPLLDTFTLDEPDAYSAP